VQEAKFFVMGECTNQEYVFRVYGVWPNPFMYVYIAMKEKKYDS